MRFKDVKVGDVFEPGRRVVTHKNDQEFHYVYDDGQTGTVWETEDFWLDDYNLVARNKTVTVSAK